jgi:hypothetical protein
LSGDGATTSTSSASSTSRRIQLNVGEFVEWFTLRLKYRLRELHNCCVKCENIESESYGHEINFLDNGSPNFDRLLENLKTLGKCQSEARESVVETDTRTTRESEERTERKGSNGREGEREGGSARGAGVRV